MNSGGGSSSSSGCCNSKSNGKEGRKEGDGLRERERL